MLHPVVSYSQASDILSGELGIEVDRKEVATLVRLFGVPVRPVPTNGKAKGLDAEGMDRLRRILRAGSGIALESACA
jgi:hypothetical protein